MRGRGLGIVPCGDSRENRLIEAVETCSVAQRLPFHCLIILVLVCFQSLPADEVRSEHFVTFKQDQYFIVACWLMARAFAVWAVGQPVLITGCQPRSLPCWGYGIRYSYGMFKQHIERPGSKLNLLRGFLKWCSIFIFCTAGAGARTPGERTAAYHDLEVGC